MSASLMKKLALATALSISATQLAANPFAELINNVTSANQQPAQAKPVDHARQEKVTNEGGRQFAAGYSKAFYPVKSLLKQGQTDQALQEHKTIFLEKDGKSFLAQVEHGLVALDANQTDTAINAFADAEHILGQEFAGSKLGSMLQSSSSNLVSMITGAGEITDYPGESFERILMLNYKSIAYMLQGERKAYNVARRSIDWQNIEKKRFRDEVELAKKELAKKEAEQKEQGNDLSGFGITDTINKYYGKSRKEAAQVPSAYVNPFGFYMTGMVQEFDSYDDRSLRDNARIAYQKALELNPKSKVIKAAAAAMKKKPRRGRKLVHIIVADGFSPEKRTVQFDYNAGGVPLPIKLPIYEAETSPIHRFEIQTVSGKRLARVHSIADINSIALRHQYDSLPFQQLNMTVNVVRSYFENRALSKLGFLGKVVGDARQEMANPDMRSWISLPERFLAARIEAPKNLSRIRIKGFDRRGRTLVNQVVKLRKDSHNFVYARNIGKVMKVATNQNKMWAPIK
ncbi:hypothetical protein [Neptunomonas sp. XY-337]|uniref:hypothetical protein n=1 Tax=Neptunomonas sp. XY-337 TaxID=2561897 RepID=UPI0010A9FB0A|nr:hypothetical protein [Neptunomonas sp. XY-337]